MICSSCACKWTVFIAIFQWCSWMRRSHGCVLTVTGPSLVLQRAPVSGLYLMWWCCTSNDLSRFVCLSIVIHLSFCMSVFLSVPASQFVCLCVCLSGWLSINLLYLFLYLCVINKVFSSVIMLTKIRVGSFTMANLLELVKRSKEVQSLNSYI